MTHFVLAYDRRHGQVVEQKDFSSITDAVTRRTDLERQFAGNSSVEVVLLGAESVENLHRTHRRYFESSAQLARESAAR